MTTGEFCPRCPSTEELWLMSTSNEWIYKCQLCRHRFNRNLEEMPEVEP
jgi:transposase-like protein